MKEEKDFLSEMFSKVAKQIGKPYQAVSPFQQELRKNWYDTPESLQNVTDDQFGKMGIPLRVATVIHQQINNALGKNKQVSPPQPNNISPPKQQQKSQKTEKKTKSVLNEAAILLLIQDLENSLLENYPYVGEQLVKILQTLHKIIKNIVSDSYQLKFRVLKKSNKTIKEIVFRNQPVVKFLKAIGFQEEEQTLVLDTFETQAFFFVQECLDQVQKNHRNQNNSQSKHFQNKNIKQPQRQDFFLPQDIKLPSNNQSVNLKDAFSKQSLEEANYAELLETLMQFRKKIMSTPPKSRQIKIYHKRFEVKQSEFVMVNMEKEMESNDNAILGKYWRDVIQNNKKNSFFQSRRKTEFQFLLKQQVYRETTIKLRLPNQLIIQARFGPLETLGDVYSVIADIVIGQFYIYQAPPVKRLDKEMHKTLDSLDSVPNGSYYIGLQTEWYIKNEFTKNIRQ